MMGIGSIEARAGPDVDVTVLSGGFAGPGLLGGKGAALDLLIGGGFAVPPTGVVTTAAYQRFATAEPIQALASRLGRPPWPTATEVDEIFSAVPLPCALLDRVAAMAQSVGGGWPVAVRSSATIEDLAGSSFAGQYRTVLDVDPADAAALEAAVKLVFASLWHPAPRAYRDALGVDDRGAAMAVVIMRMVPARSAGVVFTVDPGGKVGQARVEMVAGLGDSLVSGERTPEAFVCPRSGPVVDVPSEVARSLDLALSVETAMGTSQDVEWAWDGDRVWLLQARPITVVASGELDDGFDSPIDDHELTTMGIGEMLPGVLPPLRWELNGAIVNDAFCRLVSGLGVGIARGEPTFVRRVSGRAALDFTRLSALADELPGGSVEELESQYFGSRRPGRPAADPVPAGRMHSLRHGLRSSVLRRRADLDAEICIEAVADLADDLPRIEHQTDAELLLYRRRLFDLALRTAAAQMVVAAAATTAYRKVELSLLPHLGAADAGRFAERVTTGRGIVVAHHPDASAALFAGPTWRELDRDPVAPLASESAQRAWNELHRALAASPTWRVSGLRGVMHSRALRRLVDEAVTLLHRREASKAALLRLGGETRRVHLELGRRLVARGALDQADDVELLSTRELTEAFTGDGPSRAVLATRSRWLEQRRTEPPLPIRFVGHPGREKVELPPSDGRLDGWAASPGRASGPGVAVRDATEKLPRGTVLVAAATDASWSPLFVNAAAIVVERGGPLSHAAILARELGVPAVLNVAGATELLDGAEVTVDGDLGVVIVHVAES